jgi:hypothetical protein
MSAAGKMVDEAIAALGKGVAEADETPWLIDAAELLSRGDPGPTPWLVENLIVDRSLVAVAGRWKTTKSYGMLDVCIAIAIGRPAFGRFVVNEPGPVIFVNEESGEAALHRRLDVLCRGRAIEPEKLRGRLFVAPNRRVKLDDPDWQARLIDDGQRIRPRLVVFDPLARMKAAERNESAQNEIAVALEFMRVLRDETGAAVLFVHHVGHQGENMRGSSDMETWWDTRLRWKRDGQSPIVTVESEHREAEATPPFDYRITWDGLTRSMRFGAVRSPFEEWVEDHLRTHADASGNDVYAAAQGREDRPRKTTVLAIVKRLREGGSRDGNHPGTTPSGQGREGGSPGGLFEAPGTTPTDPPAEVVPDGRNHQWTELLECIECGATKSAKIVAGVTYFICGHKRVGA